MFKNGYTLNSKSQQGATAVEFAIIAALLMVILFGIMEYALIFLQEHYIANAAREGARIAVRANNFDCDNGDILPGYDACTSDRAVAARTSVVNFLDRLYDNGAVYNGTTITTVDLSEDAPPSEKDDTKNDRAVRVLVEVDNLFTNITPNLLKLLNINSNIENPEKISFEATMELESQEEVYED